MGILVCTLRPHPNPLPRRGVFSVSKAKPPLFGREVGERLFRESRRTPVIFLFQSFFLSVASPSEEPEGGPRLRLRFSCHRTLARRASNNCSPTFESNAKIRNFFGVRSLMVTYGHLWPLIYEKTLKCAENLVTLLSKITKSKNESRDL